MKYFLFFITIIIIQNDLSAQRPAEQIANKIAQKMKDSLSLTNSQKNGIFIINMKLNNQKNTARHQSSDNATVTGKIQKIENKRDSLYSTVLTQTQMILYKQKKRNLVNNN
jgi:hypothetical protein